MTYFECWCSTLTWKNSGCLWRKWPNLSTSYSCHQHISSRTSITNIDVTVWPLLKMNVTQNGSFHPTFFKSEIKKYLWRIILMIYEKINTMFLKRFLGDLDEIILRRFTATFYRVFTTLFTALWHALSDIKIHIFIQDMHRR